MLPAEVEVHRQCDSRQANPRDNVYPEILTYPDAVRLVVVPKEICTKNRLAKSINMFIHLQSHVEHYLLPRSFQASTTETEW